MLIDIRRRGVLHVFMVCSVGALPVGCAAPTTGNHPSATTAGPDAGKASPPWTELYGALIPRSSFRDELKAAAYLAAAVDPGMHRTVWEAAIRAALPVAERERALTELGERRAELAAEVGFAAAPPAEVPVLAWEPGIRLVAYDRFTTRGDRASVRIWAREDATGEWLQRTLSLQRADGRWVLRLPIPPAWRRSPVPEAIAQLSGDTARTATARNPRWSTPQARSH